MDVKTKIRLSKLSKTIDNSKKKIENYEKKLKGEKKISEKQKLKLKIKIEQIRIVLKNKEAELIILNDK